MTILHLVLLVVAIPGAFIGALCALAGSRDQFANGCDWERQEATDLKFAREHRVGR